MAAMRAKSEEAMPQMLEQWTEGKREGEELTMDCKTDGPAPVTGLLQASLGLESFNNFCQCRGWREIVLNFVDDTNLAELAKTLENENRIQCDLDRMRKRDKITNCMSAEINTYVNKQTIVLS